MEKVYTPSAGIIRIISRLSSVALVTIVCLMVMNPAFAQNENTYWQEWSKARYASGPTRYAFPEKFKAYTINAAQVRQLLAASPMEFTMAASQSPVILQLPMPDGRMAGFRMVESHVMDPSLAANFPLIKTYSGQGIENPAAMLKVSISPVGFHGMILSPDGNVFIDPWEANTTSDCIVYYRKDFKPYASFICETGDSFAPKNRTYTTIASGQANKTHGTQLRNYRLALACTGEYAAYYGGTTAGAMAGMVATMNRVNGVYESEVAVRMTLVPNNNLLIYLNASTDPYTNNNGSTMLGQNITNCNAVIGSANYDIGHVFSTGGGGVAYLGVPCTANKAGGVTGSGSPVGDGYDIDYVAHEMGHQFGGSHTFNATSGSCGGGNRTASAAYEPGSGITIMAYAGICTATNDLDAHSIAYFHTYSFDQITTYITSGSGNSCPTTTATGNTPPNVVPDAMSYTIPFQTPFVLNASGSDANGDALTYSWEEYDLGAAGNWNAPTGTAPIFRPFSPVVSGSRTFPKLSDILNNTTTIGEILPFYARTMNFRVTVRDNRVGGGGVMHPDNPVVVTVINTTTPFSVTSPNTAVTWTSGQQQTVTWDVSSTDLAPISCANVNILLSTDGGQTFPITLAAGTPNDGSQNITVPANITTQARIKVEAVGNIFFDISNSNFTIVSGSSTLSVISTNAISPAYLCAGQAINVSFTGDGPANSGNVYTAQLSNSAGAFTSPTAIGTLNSTASSGTIACTIPPGAAAGSAYRIRVIASAPSVTGTNNGINLSLYTALGATGTISGPASVCQGQSGVNYSVPATAGASTYNWTLPSGITITAGAGTNSITVSVSVAAVSGTINVTPSNPCVTGAVSANFPVSVGALPAAAGSISGTATLCAGQNGVAYSVPAIANATGYAWTLPSGASIATGSGTNSITVNFGYGAVSGNISVAGTNTCGNGTSASLAVTVDPTPAPPVVTAGGSTSICNPGSVTLSFTPVSGVSYQWRKNGVDLIGEVNSSYVATQAGNYDVVATVIPTTNQAFNSTGAVSIPDNSCTGGTSSIVVSGYTTTVQSSRVYLRINSLTHTWVGDLDFFLESPAGERLGLSDQTGSANNSGDNFVNTVFADSGAAILPTSGAPYTGLYKPWNAVFTVTSCTGLTTALTSFAGLGGGNVNPNGTWNLRVYDRASQDVGTIDSWSIFFPSTVSNCPAISNVINVTVGNAPVITSFSPFLVNAGNTVSINGSGFTGTTSVLFNGVSASYSVLNDGLILATAPSGAGSGVLTVTNACGSGNSASNVTVISNITLNLTVLLEGFHVSGGTMTSIVSPTQTDTITVELHNTTSPFAAVHSTQAVINLSGQASISLPSALSGNSYYIVVRHRNSLETWSKLPVLFGAVTSYNFKQ